MGHLIIAQIAYDHLTPETRQWVNEFSTIPIPDYPKSNHFVTSATWADQIKGNGNSQYNTWHYIDLPIEQDNIKAPPPDGQNVVWAIEHCIAALTNPHSTPNEKALNLRLLIHFVGDIHQPLHTASFYSKRWRTGDHGGNFYTITHPYAKNLHRYWDSGLGFLINDTASTATKQAQIKQLATQLEKKYPPSTFSPTLRATHPRQWAAESHQLAQNFAYTIPQYAIPSPYYQQHGQIIAQKQIALAGYRLAEVLNAMRSNFISSKIKHNYLQNS